MCRNIAQSCTRHLCNVRGEGRTPFKLSSQGRGRGIADQGWKSCVCRLCSSGWSQFVGTSSRSVCGCARAGTGGTTACSAVSTALQCRDGVEPSLSGFVELANSAQDSCANRKRGENWSFIALSLFPSSERSHQKIQPDKAHRPPLDDFAAVSKAERAPERSLVQPPACDKKRLRDCSSERSEGRLPRPGLSGEAWALLHIQSLSPFSLVEG